MGQEVVSNVTREGVETLSRHRQMLNVPFGTLAVQCLTVLEKQGQWFRIVSVAECCLLLLRACQLPALLQKFSYQ